MSSTSPTTSDQDKVVEVFFDGDCPLCCREIAMLRRWDRQERIQFTDITDAGFQCSSVGVDFETLMAEIHGRDAEGNLIRGVEVFRQLYEAVGFGPLVAVSRWPLISGCLNVGYRIFAKNRLRFTGRCVGDACKVPSSV